MRSRTCGILILKKEIIKKIILPVTTNPLRRKSNENMLKISFDIELKLLSKQLQINILIALFKELFVFMTSGTSFRYKANDPDTSRS